MALLVRTTLLAFAIGGAWYVLFATSTFGLAVALDELYAALGVSSLVSTIISMASGATIAAAIVGAAARRTGLVSRLRGAGALDRRRGDRGIVAALAR